jgi:hypothetical protein
MYADEEGFCQGFLDTIFESLEFINPEEAEKWVDKSVIDFRLLSRFITKLCKGRKIVLIIDESDEASNNEIFVMFLKMLRDKYLLRNNGDDYTFHSVILAGVYDVRNLKQKMVLAGNYTPSSGESSMNSPWNIAVDFKIDMSFSAKEIETMLVEYEKDHHTCMNISEIAQEIRYYTSGYPYLVSRICLLIVRDLDKNWTLKGVQKAIKIILTEESTLFDDLFKKIEENQELQNLLFNLTINKKYISYTPHDPVVKLGLMFCFLGKDDRRLIVHNKIFEIVISDYLISKNTRISWNSDMKETLKNDIIKGDFFDMELCLTKFKRHYAEIYTNKDLKLLERDGKLIFMTYLMPLINGIGFYHFESETRDFGKMDLVIDYLTQQFILELKIWYGDSKHEDAYEQLSQYLISKNIDCGYLLTFDFRKKGDDNFIENKWIECNGKRIFDVVVRVGTEDND